MYTTIPYHNNQTQLNRIYQSDLYHRHVSVSAHRVNALAKALKYCWWVTATYFFSLFTVFHSVKPCSGYKQTSSMVGTAIVLRTLTCTQSLRCMERWLPSRNFSICSRVWYILHIRTRDIGFVLIVELPWWRWHFGWTIISHVVQPSMPGCKYTVMTTVESTCTQLQGKHSGSQILIHDFIICCYKSSCNIHVTANCWGYNRRYRTSQNVCDRKISRIAAKKGGRSICDKNIREGGSDTLSNTVTYSFCVQVWGSSGLWRWMNPSQYYMPSRVFSGYTVLIQQTSYRSSAFLSRRYRPS